jgi:hypothetical protein
MVGYAPPEFRAARYCFVTSALILGGMDIVWQVQTDKSLLVRLTVGVLLWGLIGAGLPETLRWVKRRENPQQERQSLTVKMQLTQQPYLVSPAAKGEDYLLVPNLIVTNSDAKQAVSLSLHLIVSGHSLETVNIPIAEWARLQTSNQVSGQPQLTFPLNLAPLQSSGGYVAFRAIDELKRLLSSMNMALSSPPGTTGIFQDVLGVDVWTFEFVELNTGLKQSIARAMTGLTKHVLSAQPSSQPAKSAAQLSLSRIEAFEQFSIIDTGKQLAFRVSFKNGSKQDIVNSSITVLSFIGQTLDPATISRYVGILRTAGVSEEALNGVTSRIIPAIVGDEIHADTTLPMLGAEQASGLLDGSWHVYLFVQAAWKGADGLTDSTEICAFMQKPQSKQLKPIDVKVWGIYPTADLLSGTKPIYQ